MEATLSGKDLGLAGRAGDLEGRFVSLCAGVGEEHAGAGHRLGGLPTLLRQQAFKPLSELDHLRVGEKVRRVAERGDLTRYGVNNGWVSVPQSVNGDTGQQVQVIVAVDVGDDGAAARHELARRGAVGLEDRGVPVALPVSAFAACHG